MAARVSVCIPVRNDAAFVGAAIASALAQRDVELQVLVSDNASSDASWARIGEYPACIAYRQPQALPMATHWNWFRGRAEGDWLLFLCSDDVLHPQALARCLALAAAAPRPPAAVFFESDDLVGDEVRRKTAFYAQAALIPAPAQHRVFIIGNNYPLSMALLRREALDAVGWFDEGYAFCTDWQLWLKLSALDADGLIGYLPDKLGLYRQHGGNETGRCVRERIALDEVIRMKQSFLERLGADRSAVAARAARQVGRLALRYAQALAARGDAAGAAFYREHYAAYIAQAAAPSPDLPAQPPYPLPAGARVVTLDEVGCDV